MDKQDVVLLSLFAKVKRHVEPEDHPASSFDIAQEVHLSLEQTLLFCDDLVQEGFIKISPLSSPPLVYLTISGLARARRLNASCSVFHHKSA